MALNVDLLNLQLQGLYNRKDELIATATTLELETQQVEAQIQATVRQIRYLEGGSVPAVNILAMVADFVATATDLDEITLTWTQNNQATSYEVWFTLNPFSEEYQLLTTLNGTDLVTYVHQNLSNGVTYYYKIIAKSEGWGNSPAASAAATAFLKLGLIENFTLTPDDGEVVLGWDLLADAQTYEVYRHTANDFSAASKITTVASDGYTDTAVVNETLYYYWIIPTAANYVAGDYVTGSATPTSGE